VNLSGISNKSLLGRILRSPLRLLPSQAVFPILQSRLKGRVWIVGSSNHGCWLGSYEYAKRLVFEKTIQEGSVVFDIGAHAGFYTLLASVLVGPKGRVYAFEPVPGNLHYLTRHLRLNHVENVTIIQAAVLNTCGVTSFDEGPNRSMAHVSAGGKLQVDTVALDELIARAELPVPNYIKIDIEGAELLALSGSKSMLMTSHPVLFLTTHGRDIHRQCRLLLESAGYRLQALDGLNLEQSGELLASYGEVAARNRQA